MSSFWDRPGGHRQFIAAICASFGALSFGATVGWTAPAQDDVSRGKLGYSVSFTQYGWVCAVCILGSGVVSFPAAILANCVGRKLLMLLMVAPYMAGWALTIYSINLYLLIGARFLQGFCGGCYITVVPIYCMEIAQQEFKSVMSNFVMIFYMLGILFAFILGVFKNIYVLSYGCAAWPLIFLLSFVWMPESPVYYLLKKNDEKAMQSLQWLRGKHFDVSNEFNRITDRLKISRGYFVIAWFKFRRTTTASGIVVCSCLMGLKSFCGSVAIITYATFIMRNSNTEEFIRPELSTLLLGFFFCLSAIIAITGFCGGKRNLIICFIVIIMVNCGLLAIFFRAKTGNEDYVYKLTWLPLVCLCCFSFFFGLGLDVLPYVIMNEMFGHNVEIVAGAIAHTFSGICGFGSALAFPFTYEAFNMEMSFWGFTGISFLAFLFVFFFVPEHTGRTLSEARVLPNRRA